MMQMKLLTALSLSLLPGTLSSTPAQQPEQLLTPSQHLPFRDPATPPSSAVSFGDVNLLIVTDAHSWISKHAHPDYSVPLDAGYGEIASAVEHVKALAAEQGRDVFFLNNGDHTEGSGLSDASVYTAGVHGYDLFPLIQLMPFDALTIGNHDLYDTSTVSFMKHESGFIDSWAGNYLTSNTVSERVEGEGERGEGEGGERGEGERGEGEGEGEGERSQARARAS
jgi:2',3'-cyclic-nucleotide 2'-phosphodiesterase (5'-nucleotidase family)